MAEIDMWLVSAIFFTNTHCECVLFYDGFFRHTLLEPCLRVRTKSTQ